MAEESFDAEGRIAEMVKAIKYKSGYQAEQLTNQARDAHDAEYNKILDLERSKAIEKFTADRAKFVSDKKIEKSRLFNELRLSKMAKRFSLLENLRADVRRELQKKLSNKDEYKKLLKSLIVQSMIKLMEPEVELQCLKNDVAIVESLVKDCQTEFNSLVSKECKRNIDSKIKVNKDHFLDEKNKDLLGGVVLSCMQGKIVCSNTIDSRVEFAFQEMLPEIREGLYPDPVRAAHDQKRKAEQLQAQIAAAGKTH